MRTVRVKIRFDGRSLQPSVRSLACLMLALLTTHHGGCERARFLLSSIAFHLYLRAPELCVV